MSAVEAYDSGITQRGFTMKPSDSNLTPRQLSFCRLLAEGKLSTTQCYRDAYSTTAKPTTVQKLAYREKNKPHVSRYVDYLIGQKEAAHRAKSLNDRDLTLDSVRRCLKGEITLSSDQVASANILAKASGLFVTQIADVTPKSSDEITAMLERKLAELELTSDELH